ncbi:hypothetical protein HJC23_007584 [Cyclotella cryptica]|uniref:Uncharacterized protein n=1 Tax=Cyclotella cryptica TaxID=29204 RepID=A0ABD3QRS6_9STRA
MIFFIFASLVTVFTAHWVIAFTSNACPNRAKFTAGTKDYIHSIRWTNKYLSRKLEPHIFASRDFRDGTSAMDFERRRATLGRVPIISRTIPIGINVSAEPKENCTKKTLNVTIWEMERPSEIIQTWWSVEESERSVMGDPFGVVMWPGSILASKELMKHHYCSRQSQIENATVLVLGAGTGVEAQTAGLLGARKVIATDINQMALGLLKYAIDNHGDSNYSMSSIVECRYFDVYSDQKLPHCDILVAADVLYNSDLAKRIGLRVHELVSYALSENGAHSGIIITDSQKFHGTDFLLELKELRELNELLLKSGLDQLQWEDRKLQNVVGSGVLLDGDLVYDADVRLLSWGWTTKTR